MPKSRRPAVRLLAMIPLMVAAAVLLAAGPGATAAAAPAAGRTIVFFGDSLTAGYGLDDPAGRSYPGLIAARLAADPALRDWRVVNAGLSGETSAGGLRRIDWTLRTAVDVFVLALGANDGLRGIDPALTRRNLQQILDKVRAKFPRASLVVAGMQMPRELGLDYTREFQALFPALAEQNRATLIPFLLEGVAAQPALNQGDRIHPNPAGHAVIADTVWSVIRPLL